LPQPQHEIYGDSRPDAKGMGVPKTFLLPALILCRLIMTMVFNL
jgi:hypothetical protein